MRFQVNMMRLDDPVHGSVTVEDAVLQELLGSSPVQRLNEINQTGPQRYYMDKPVTRFQHSVGVMLLLRQFDADIEEQVAGLLHDVPHTAFSHLADFLFDTEEHDYHEQFMERVVRDSEIPAILERHGLDLEYILDEENFPLLERDLPDLCADRIDYFLRDWAVTGGEDISSMRSALAVDDDMFVLSDRDVAEEYAINYIQANRRWWANPHELAIWELFSRAMQRAMDIGIITKEDLFGTDDEVYRELVSAGDKEITRILERLDRGVDVVVDPENPDMVPETKFRYVDPLVVVGGERTRVSAYSERFRERLEEYREYMEGGVPLRVTTEI